MEAQARGIQEVFVDEEVHLVVFVVDEAERGDAAGFQAEVFLHAGLRGEGELALVQTLLQVVDVHLVHALEDNEVVLVALVVTEKQVLAVRGLKLAPVGQRLLDGTQRRVELDVEVDAEAKQGVHYLLLPLTQGLVYFGWFHILSFWDCFARNLYKILLKIFKNLILNDFYIDF